MNVSSSSIASRSAEIVTESPRIRASGPHQLQRELGRGRNREPFPRLASMDLRVETVQGQLGLTVFSEEATQLFGRHDVYARRRIWVTCSGITNKRQEMSRTSTEVRDRPLEWPRECLDVDCQGIP